MNLSINFHRHYKVRLLDRLEKIARGKYEEHYFNNEAKCNTVPFRKFFENYCIWRTIFQNWKTYGEFDQEGQNVCQAGQYSKLLHIINCNSSDSLSTMNSNILL